MASATPQMATVMVALTIPVTEVATAMAAVRAVEREANLQPRLPTVEEEEEPLLPWIIIKDMGTIPAITTATIQARARAGTNDH